MCQIDGHFFEFFSKDLYKWKRKYSEKCKTTRLCQRDHVFGKVLKGPSFLRLSLKKKDLHLENFRDLY